MPRFHFIAKKNPKETIEDDVEAESREAALHHIIALGYTPLRVTAKETAQENAESSAEDARIPAKELESFTRQFASLIRSQIPVLNALRVLENQITYLSLKQITAAVSARIQSQGDSLSEALKNYPKAFPQDYTNLVAAGEVGGALQEVLDQLALKLEKEEELRSKLLGALAYPVFVGITGVLTVIFMLTFVMPKILKILESLKANLPLPTRMLLGLTKAMSHEVFWLTAIPLCAAAGAVLYSWVRKNRLAVDRFLLKVPVLGALVRDLEMVRFCRSFGLLLRNGVLILQAIESAVPVVGNYYIRHELSRLPEKIREGHALTDGFRAMPLLATPYFIQSVAIGEEGGRLSEVLMEITNFYEKEVTKRLQFFATLLEPVMILGVGLMVGFIVMAVLLPIFELSTAAR